MYLIWAENTCIYLDNINLVYAPVVENTLHNICSLNSGLRTDRISLQNNKGEQMILFKSPGLKRNLSETLVTWHVKFPNTGTEVLYSEDVYLFEHVSQLLN